MPFLFVCFLFFRLWCVCACVYVGKGGGVYVKKSDKDVNNATCFYVKMLGLLAHQTHIEGAEDNRSSTRCRIP